MANVEYYERSNTGDVLMDVESYFKLVTYKRCVVDMIIVTTADPLHLSLSIYWKGLNKNIQVMQKKGGRSSRDVHL